MQSIINDQSKFIDHFVADVNARAALKKTLAECMNEKCTVCAQMGHIGSYCPINSMMYHKLRGKPDTYTFWLMVKMGRRVSKR